jgi:hypothetical protein
LPACALQLVDRRGEQPGATGTEGVTYGYCAAVWIDVWCVLCDPEFAQHRNGLSCERLIQLYCIQLLDSKTRTV